MERYEIGDDPRMAALVEAAARGDEAVITRDGEVVAAVTPRSAVAAVFDRASLDALHTALPASVANGGPSIADLRAMGDH